MNIEEYISSGIIESYVLGVLDEREAAEVEANAARYPAISEELRKVQDAMEEYAMAYTVTPADRVKKKLFAEIVNKKAQESVKSIEFPKQRSAFNWMVAASVAVTILSIASSVYFRIKWMDAERQLISMREENAVIAQKANYIIQSNEEERKQQAAYFAFVKDTATAKVALKGLALSPSSGAIVFWNKYSSQLYIDIQSLPVPPPGMQYQLWALDNGTPIDAGVFSVMDIHTLQKMKCVNSAQAFAVTLEKEGGSASPTLEAMYILGTL